MSTNEFGEIISGAVILLIIAGASLAQGVMVGAYLALASAVLAWVGNLLASVRAPTAVLITIWAVMVLCAAAGVAELVTAR